MALEFKTDRAAVSEHANEAASWVSRLHVAFKPLVNRENVQNDGPIPAAFNMQLTFGTGK